MKTQMELLPEPEFKFIEIPDEVNQEEIEKIREELEKMHDELTNGGL